MAIVRDLRQEVIDTGLERELRRSRNATLDVVADHVLAVQPAAISGLPPPEFHIGDFYPPVALRRANRKFQRDRDGLFR